MSYIVPKHFRDHADSYVWVDRNGAEFIESSVTNKHTDNTFYTGLLVHKYLLNLFLHSV